jgi:hypothetical protein
MSKKSWLGDVSASSPLGLGFGRDIIWKKVSRSVTIKPQNHVVNLIHFSQ